jgi:PilZ domain
MTDGDTRQSDRRACEGKVLVTQLSGGPDLVGSLVEIGGGGVRIIVERPLYCGDMVRLILPGRPGGVRNPGRPIVGKVRHSGGTPGRHVIGIAFDGDTGVEKEPPPSRRKIGLWSWFRHFSQKKMNEDRSSRTTAKKKERASSSTPHTPVR